LLAFVISRPHFTKAGITPGNREIPGLVAAFGLSTAGMLILTLWVWSEAKAPARGATSALRPRRDAQGPTALFRESSRDFATGFAKWAMRSRRLSHISMT